MPRQSKGTQLKYQRIADALKADVESGRYGPGDRLPGENELMEQHGVARMTARHALGVLRSEGIVEARKGAGVFVRSFRPLRRSGIRRLAGEQWAAGRSVWSADLGDQRVLTVDRVVVEEAPASARVAGLLGVPAGQPVWERRRRYVLDGKPVLLAGSRFPAELVRDTAVVRPDPGPGGVYARLGELGHAPTRFREEITARTPTAAEAAELSRPSTVILITRTAFTATGTVVEVNDMVLDAASYILEYEFDA
ncbi:GntR family transcriptional regulator [Streptomyces sp. NPDC087440]|uniref:GntR family transcriptional regulator n=1 Tax=Streptomyces sp. NPDC087440 TaxID=3365790 RepID=UPI00382554F8